MPKKSKKKSKETSKTGFRYMGRWCCNCGKEMSSLLTCSRCGMVSYCSKDCQRAAYKEHREFCKQAASDLDKNDHNALRGIMFSRCFGGAVSLLMNQIQHVRRLKGVLHVKCSHPLVEYCERRRDQDKRSLSITFVPEGDEVLRLQESALSPGQPQRDEDGQGALEAAMTCRANLAQEFGSLASDMDERLALVTIEQPGILGLKNFIFFNYMGASHPAHMVYTNMLHDPSNRWPGISERLVLDWDWNPTIPDDMPDEAIDVRYDLQCLIYNCIGPKFYQSCSLAYQEKRRKKDKKNNQFWPNNSLTPPLALGVDLRAGNPLGGIEGSDDWKYTMHFSSW